MRAKRKGDEKAMVVGVDGCREGWVCFFVAMRSRKTSVRFLPTIKKLLGLVPNPKVIAVDIPIGLVEFEARSCDVAARRLLGKPRSSSVFPAPIRSVLSAASYEKACRIARLKHGKALSKQSDALRPKIREVDVVITQRKQGWVREVHPEVCFWAMNNKQPMKHKKSSTQGREERLAILRKYFSAIDSHLAELRGKCHSHDVIDAAAAAWTAVRLVNGEAKTVSDPELDRKGLRMEIVY
ncbi:MAG: DUF429 domain-containing protein [Candidatus Acidiferrales bacterium]